MDESSSRVFIAVQAFTAEPKITENEDKSRRTFVVGVNKTLSILNGNKLTL